MRLAFCLFKYFPYGGLQRDFKAIALACKHAGYEIDVFTLEWQGETIPEFNVHILPGSGLTNHQRYRHFAEQVAQYLAKYSYMGVIGFNKMPYLTVYFAADTCYRYYLKYQRPAWYHWLPRSRSLLAAEHQVFARDHQNHILALAEQQVDEYQSCYQTPKARFSLLPPYIKADRFYSAAAPLKRIQVRQHYGIAEHDWLVLAIGSGFRSKGLDRSLVALASLPVSMRKRLHFLIIGQDKFTVFQRQAQRLGLTQQVHYLGGCSNIPDFLFTADLLLHPAYKESAGIVLLEAVVAGLPVLTTAACGYSHHILAAKAGRVLSEPFVQAQLNQTLFEMLNSLAAEPWQINGIQYGKKHAFQDMATVASQHIQTYLNHYQIQQTATRYLWQHQQESPLINQPDAFAAVQSLKGEVFRQVKTRKTLRYEYQGNAYFVKIHQGIGWQECLKSYVRLQKPVVGAQTEFYALQRMATAHLNSLTVVAAGWEGNNPVSQVSFLVTKALIGMENLEILLDAWDTYCPTMKQQYQLVKAVARLIRDMHAIGINHRDLYSCHLVAKVKPQSFIIDFEDLQIAVLDLHRAQLRSAVPERWKVKDVGSLLFSTLNTRLTKRHWLCFMREYTQQSLRDILPQKFWQKVRRRALQLQRKALRNKLTIAGKRYEQRVLF